MDNTEKDNVESRHRKEKKELQGRIQLLKKTATKGDKKKKKEVSDEIARLEQELEKKHSEELAQLEATDTCTVNSELNDMVENLERIPSNFKEVPMRVTKAQKRRDKKAQHEKEREQEIKEQEKLNVYGARNLEIQKIKSILKEKNLMVYEIPTDGNCLYCAVDHQLTQIGDPALGLEKLRVLTSKILLENVDDYLPFMSHPETGGLLTEEQYKDYCNKVATTSAWGGEIELQALARVLKRRIQVIQAEGPFVTVGEEFPADKQLMLTYHRHMYGLGEHYNSVKPYEEPVEETS
ncbi:OTU domain-containing protein 6B [Gryllus bimaculatus]|nr:OTU domain-containing protein 6B [Gryllus bimaculatus]